MVFASKIRRLVNFFVFFVLILNWTILRKKEFNAIVYFFVVRLFYFLFFIFVSDTRSYQRRKEKKKKEKFVRKFYHVQV